MSGDPRTLPETPGEGSAIPPTRDVLLGEARDHGGGALDELLKRWRDEVRIRANAQQLAAADDARNSLILGVAVTILAATGAGILTVSGDQRMAVVAGWATFAAAVLAGVQTATRFGERSGAHRGAAASYSRVKTRLDLLLARGRVPTDNEVDDLTVVMERLDTETPVVSNRYWRRAIDRIKSGSVS